MLSEHSVYLFIRIQILVGIVLKYQQHGTSHNLNQGRSGRNKAERTKEDIGMVRDLLQDNPTVSTRRNKLPLKGLLDYAIL